MNSNTSPYFIGVAGGTAGGKTTLARRFVELGEPGEVSIVYLDSYYRAQDHIDLADRAKVNYDHPDAFEVELLLKHLQQLKAGEAVEMPRYDFGMHTRAVEPVPFAVTPVILIEGILTLHFTDIQSFVDTSIFVDAPDETRLSRRIERDVRERDRTEESVIAQWEETVQPMHYKFCLPTRDAAAHIIDGTQDNDTFVNSFLQSTRS